MNTRTNHRGAYAITASDHRQAAACRRGCTLAEATAARIAYLRSPVWWMRARARARAATRRGRHRSDEFLHARLEALGARWRREHGGEAPVSYPAVESSITEYCRTADAHGLSPPSCTFVPPSATDIASVDIVAEMDRQIAMLILGPEP